MLTSSCAARAGRCALRLALGVSAVALAVGAAAPARAQSSAQSPVSLIDRIQVGGVGLEYFDISYVDSARGLYVLSDRSNAGVDFIDSHNDAFLGRVGGFAGEVFVDGKPDNAISGPDGVATVGNEVWAGDGDSTVKVIGVNHRITHVISTNGQFRADELSWDPADNLVAVANNADAPPFLSLIDTRSYTVVKQIFFDGTMGTPNATGGLEQSQYSPSTGYFYVSVPQVGSNPAKGGVSVIDPKSMRVLFTYPVTNCTPAGLSIGPKNNALLGCSAAFGTAPNILTQSVIANLKSGKLTDVTQVGGSDEVWYDKGTTDYYLGARNNLNPDGTPNPVLGVIDAMTNTYVGGQPTSVTAHSVAADAVSHHVFVPIGMVLPGVTDPTNPCPTKGCIAVYAPSSSGG